MVDKSDRNNEHEENLAEDLHYHSSLQSPSLSTYDGDHIDDEVRVMDGLAGKWGDFMSDVSSLRTVDGKSVHLRM